MNNLRSQYNHERYKKRRSAASDPYRPTIYWFPKLHFLDSFMTERKREAYAKTSLDDSIDLKPSDEPASDDETSCSQITAASSRKRRISVSAEASDALHLMSSPARNQRGRYSNDVEAFGEHVKAQLSLITVEELRDKVMQSFDTILFEIKRKERALKWQQQIL